MWKIIIITALVFIIFSLFSALIFLIRDQGSGERTVRSLSWRVGLSLLLVVFIAFSHYFGFVESGSPQPDISLLQNVNQNK